MFVKKLYIDLNKAFFVKNKYFFYVDLFDCCYKPFDLFMLSAKHTDEITHLKKNC